MPGPITTMDQRDDQLLDGFDEQNPVWIDNPIFEPNGSEPDTDELINSGINPLFAGNTQEPQSLPPVSVNQQEAVTIPGLTTALKATEKSRSSDSGSYRDAIVNMEGVNDILRRRVTPADFSAIGAEAISRYNLLLESCQAYLDTHRGFRWTGTGRARVALVKQITEIARRDLRALYDGSAALSSRPEGMTLLELVGSQARTVSVNLDDGREVKLRGAGSSTRYQFNEGEQTFFFTREETLLDAEDAQRKVISEIADQGTRELFEGIFQNEATRSNITNGVWLTIGNNPDFLEIENAGRAKYNSPLYTSMGEYIVDNFPALAGLSYDFVSEDSCTRFCDICVAITRAKSGSENFHEMGQIKTGATVSTRNAAMSRLADLLGIGDLLARSVTADVTINGQIVRGNLMEKARGEAIEDIDPEKLQNVDLSTAELQRQLVCLQFLDALCGQVDRNIGNYFLSAEKDDQGNVLRFNSIQGIDNDMSFGEVLDLSKNNEKLKPILTESGGSALPVIDRQLGERLLAVTPDMVIFAVADIITDRGELDALSERLFQIQTALQALKEQDGQNGQKTFLDITDWGETSRQALMGPPNRGASNYYAAFVNNVKGHSKNFSLGNTPAAAHPGGGPVSVSAFVMSASTLSFLLNRKDVSAQDRRRLEGMLTELLDTYHRSESSGDSQPAFSLLKRIAEVCESRRGEVRGEASQRVLDTLKKQCLARLAQLNGLPLQDANESPGYGAGFRAIEDMLPDEIVDLDTSDPFPEYTRLSQEEARALSDSNPYNQGSNRDIIYGDRPNTHGDNHGYILTPNSMTINRGLRGEVPITQNSQTTIDTLDQAAVSGEVPRKTRFHRMLGTGYLQHALGLKNTEAGVVTAGHAAQISKMTGTVITDSGFMCVGYLVDAMFASNSVMLTLLCDEGTPVFPTDNHRESEMIFGRGTSYMLLGAKLYDAQGPTLPLSNMDPGNSPQQKGVFKGLEIFAKIIK